MPALNNLLPEEIFKPMIGHERYLISNLGRVYSTKRQKYQIPFKSTRGFIQVNVDNKNVTLHIELARAFATKTPNGTPYTVRDVKFLNGDCYDIRLPNLAWKEEKPLEENT
jgi:hypothetical protein